MAKYTANQLRASMELGSTSLWVISFLNVSGSSAPDASLLNFIKTDEGDFSTVSDVEYDQSRIKKYDFSVGPGLEFSIPVFQQGGNSLKVTFFDDHFKSIRSTLLDWVRSRLQITQGRAPSLASLKQSSLLMSIHHYDKQTESLNKDDVFYVIPEDSIVFRGDQEFSADTIPVSFTILGTQ